MGKRSVYTKITPLPLGIPRAVAVEALHDHFLMIDLNPYVEKRYKMEKPPRKGSAEEYFAVWYEIIDRIPYMPGISGHITYHACFHDLEDGLQTHCFAAMGVDIKGKWTIGGNEPGEARKPIELGLNAPKDGLYIREDVDFTCNMVFQKFVKAKLLDAHKILVDRLVEKAKIDDANLRSPNMQSVTMNSSSMNSSPRHDYAEPNSPYSHRFSRQGTAAEAPGSSYLGSPSYPPSQPMYHHMSAAQEKQQYANHLQAQSGHHPAYDQPQELPAGPQDHGPVELPGSQ